MEDKYDDYLISIIKLMSSRYSLELEGLTKKEQVNLIGNYIELEYYISTVKFKDVGTGIIYDGDLEEIEEQEVRATGVESITIGGK